ncbi:hypothetical protein I4U23_009815 [Adineta vaga]|nr:hypothetical protein I4U23_009815 [Adineta vaga]
MRWKFNRCIIIILISIICIHSDELSTLNEQFITTYVRARDHLVSLISPLIICNGDNIILNYRGQRFEEQVIPKLYHDLKTISHIPFKIYLTLMFNTGNISENNSIELQRYLESIHRIRKSLHFSNDSLQNQYDIIDLSIKYLEGILSTKFVHENQLRKFCQQAQHLFLSNIELAAQLHLDLLDEKVRVWYYDRFNQTERDELKVVIMGPKTARHGFLEKTYFYHLIGEKKEGKRIIYVENADTEEKALEVLGVWLLDAEAGATFFDGDTERLHQTYLVMQPKDTSSDCLKNQKKIYKRNILMKENLVFLCLKIVIYFCFRYNSTNILFIRSKYICRSVHIYLSYSNHQSIINNQ